MELILAEIRRKRLLVPVPWPIARIQAKVLEKLPKPLLTTDQLVQLGRDNVVAPDARTLADLGVEATAVEVILPTYLDRYRAGGRFAARQKLS
jgi:NADH dehydrogenase